MGRIALAMLLVAAATLLSVGYAEKVVELSDATDLDIDSIYASGKGQSSRTYIGEGAGSGSGAPPETVVDSGEVAAVNQPAADFAAQGGNGTTNSTGSGFAGPIVLPPAVMGGTYGEFTFQVTNPLPDDDSAGVTSLGEGESSAQVPTQVTAAVDKTFSSLFDLKPLFMGIQADIHRRRALLGGVCVMSLNDIVHEGICKDGHLSDGKCTMYSVPPMSIAMQTLYNNARTNFCKTNSSSCDATMCYNYGGPISPAGQLESSYHVMDNMPIWVHVHESHPSGNGTSVATDQVVTQMISFKISLEKAVFCEKLNPTQTAAGDVKVLSCYTSRRCKMLSLEHKGCQDASSDQDPAPSIACPTDVSFIKAVQEKESALTATLCSSL